MYNTTSQQVTDDHTAIIEPIGSQQPAILPGLTPGAQPIIIQIVKQPGGTCGSIQKHFKSRAATILASFQLCLGVASIILSAVAIHIDAHGAHAGGSGFINPVFWFIAGAFGLAAGCSRMKGIIITNMVINIISTVITLCCLVLVSFGTTHDSVYYEKYYYDYGNYNCDYVQNNETGTFYHDCDYEREEGLRILVYQWHAKVAMDSVIITITVAEAIMSIISAVLCCPVVCCSKPDHKEEEQTATIRYVVNDPEAVAVAASSPSADVEKGPLSGPAVAPDYSADPPPQYHSGYTTDLNDRDLLLE